MSKQVFNDVSNLFNEVGIKLSLTNLHEYYGLPRPHEIYTFEFAYKKKNEFSGYIIIEYDFNTGVITFKLPEISLYSCGNSKKRFIKVVSTFNKNTKLLLDFFENVNGTQYNNLKLLLKENKF